MTRSAQADLASQAEPLATDPQPRARDYEAKPGYQQQLTDRTQTPLPTNTRMVAAKARLEAPRRTWLGSQAEPLATDPQPRARDYEAKPGYQQQLTDRTQTPLPTNTRIVAAKARLEAPRRTWLARLNPRNRPATTRSRL